MPLLKRKVMLLLERGVLLLVKVVISSLLQEDLMLRTRSRKLSRTLASTSPIVSRVHRHAVDAGLTFGSCLSQPECAKGAVVARAAGVLLL